ncbi:spermatogenesis-associated protein 31D1 [Fukomys damarensis]|uniref:spermatogenesis-associated protein 31D1 n=1 Tax=Fukomys damarensis TaxID=885580 RepID=UPI0014551387|nr:spermatogenesis-associated protein 31D1 [Fukomys damarensis]
MENVLFYFLNSYIEPWLSFGSSFLDTDPHSTFMNAVGLLFLLFCYLSLKSFLPSFWDKKDISKLQSRKRRRRRITTLKAWRAGLRERQEGRKLLSILKSPLGQYPDINHLRQLLCPDPLCDVCNTTTAKVSRMLSQASLEDTDYSVSSVTSTDSDSSCTQTFPISTVLPRNPISALVPKSSPSSHSALPPNPVTSSVDSQSPAPLGDSQQAEPIPPLDSRFPLAFPPPLLTQEAKSDLQPENTSSVENPGGFSTNNFHPMEVSFQVDTEDHLIEPRNLKFLSPDSQAFRERQIKKRGDLLLGKGKGKRTESFPKQHQPDSPLSFSWKRSESATDQKDSVYTLPNWNREGKSEGLHPHLKLPCPKTLEDHLEQKHTQLFWGPPSLHGESLNPTVPISDPGPASVPTPSSATFSSMPAWKLWTEKQHLETDMLLKVEQSMWGLPSVVQRSQEDFCPPDPKLSPISQASKAHVPVPTLREDFPCSSELRKKLEHHLQKRLIQHRWGLPRRVQESLSLMQPQSKVPETSKSKESHGLSWISFYKGKSSKDLSQYETYKRTSEMLLPEGVGKNQGHRPEIGPQNLLSGHNRIIDSTQGSYSENTLQSQVRKKPGASVMSALQAHLSKKCGEIHEGQIPGTVNKSWRSINQTLPFSEKSSRQIKDRNQTSLAGKDRYLNTSQDISFISSSKQKMLEEHIKTFQRRMMWGLPHKVQESIDISKIKEDLYPALSHSKFPSSGTSISDVGSKMEVYKTLTKTSNAFQAQQIESNSDVDCPHATSHVGMEGRGALTQSPSYTNCESTESMKMREDGTWVSVLPSHSNTDSVSQKQTLEDKRCHSKLALQAGPEINKRMSSCNEKQRLQGKVTTQWEVVKAKELCGLQSQTSNILMTGKSEATLRRDANTRKPETSLTTKRPLTRAAVPQDFKSSNLQNQLMSELKRKIESRKQSQTQGLPVNVSPASSNLKTKTLLHHDEGTSYGYTAASPVMHAHLDNTKPHTGQGQEPGVTKRVLCKCQHRKFPPEAKRVCPHTLTARDLSGGDARLSAHQHQRRNCPDQDRMLEKTRGSKFSSALSLREQPPPDNSFRDKMKQFFQRICPSVKHRGQESPQKKASSSSSVQTRGPVRGKTDFPENTKDRKVATSYAKVLCQNSLEGRFISPK